MGLQVEIVVSVPKPQWEFPRLCRGGSKSLTYPAVDTAAPSTKLQIAKAPSRRMAAGSALLVAVLRDVFDHEAYVREMGAQHGFNYTALRPQLVTGPTPGALNVLPAIGVYAANSTPLWDSPLVKRRNNLIQREVRYLADEGENLPRVLLQWRSTPL